ncbi:MAG: hypothetical protein J07HQW1_02494 [Haloquadratum walsbyi J07HQW1]|uniref:Uncharacterized protein n=1 Tax=Haloquadratum walsbyi J07HQW1 TaxID=1238424 RepID=U1N710_9EURY|nr:MAG: hypothetical protein J07HQW1_02494 [Haloquadratum walsbyi J07HQW1]
MTDVDRNDIDGDGNNGNSDIQFMQGRQRRLPQEALYIDF